MQFAVKCSAKINHLAGLLPQLGQSYQLCITVQFGGSYQKTIFSHFPLIETERIRLMQRLLGKVQEVPNTTIGYFCPQDRLFQIIFPYFD